MQLTARAKWEVRIMAASVSGMVSALTWRATVGRGRGGSLGGSAQDVVDLQGDPIEHERCQRVTAADLAQFRVPRRRGGCDRRREAYDGLKSDRGRGAS